MANRKSTAPESSEECRKCGTHLGTAELREKGMCDDCAKKRQSKNYSIGYEWKNVRGQVFVYLPDHPHAAKTGMVPRSHLVMSEMLGRWLTAEERVYHIDGDPGNDEPENLRLFASMKELAQHRSELYHERVQNDMTYEKLMAKARKLGRVK